MKKEALVDGVQLEGAWQAIMRAVMLRVVLWAVKSALRGKPCGSVEVEVETRRGWRVRRGGL